MADFVQEQFIGGTHAAALAGVNPRGWAQPIDVYLALTGAAPERRQSGMMALGQLMEQLVADLFTEATGIRLRRPSQAVRSRQYPWAGGHIDRWADDGGVFEAKWTMRHDEWGPGLGAGTPEAPVIIPAPGDDSYRPKVPLRYAVQVQHYLAVTGRPIGYLAVLLGYADFRWYALHRDERMIGMLMQGQELFWRENYLARVPPVPDGSEAYGRYLRRAYATDDGEERVATPEQVQLVDAYRAADQASKAAAAELERQAQLLQDSMGTTAQLVGPGFRVRWRSSKHRLVVQWEELATRLLEQAYPEAVPTGIELPEQFPTTKKARAELVRRVARELELAEEQEGARPFRVEFDSDESEG
jgi:predicted phage-related endonuclease